MNAIFFILCVWCLLIGIPVLGADASAWWQCRDGGKIVVHPFGNECVP
jgi:hypothetical protein